MMKRGNKPYKPLGDALTQIRTRIQESIAEVSGAVEINDDTLMSYERGEKRPSEDILQLMITHFNLKDEESDKLWDLAGYEENKLPLAQAIAEENYSHQPAMVILPLDARIVYSDGFQVSINQYGVIMNFVQNTGPNGQQVPISRVGMSLEHAKRVAETLQQTIKTASELNHQKNLPAPGDNNKGTTK